jgi:hypothetical protein
MKNSKIILCFAILNVLAFSSYAQLSERVNNPGKFKTGTRPVAGDMGFYLGFGTGDIKKKDKQSGDSTEVKNVLPLVCIKYYINDDLVFRIGVKTTKDKAVMKGEVDPAINGIGGLISKTDINTVSELYFTPGIEKHFLNSNLLDAYVVATMPLGRIHEKVENDWHNEIGDFQEQSVTKNSFAYGLEGHIGLQAFIADLPVAIGFEAGISGIGYRGNKYKNVVNSSFGGVEMSEEYFTTKDDPQNIKYSNLKSNTFETDGSLRVTISYYFRK